MALTRTGDVVASPEGARPAGSIELCVGSRITCRDDDCGILTRFVVDPKDRSLTHFVAERKQDRTSWSRLVPVDLVEHVGDKITLSCNFYEFRGLEPATEVQSVETPLEQPPNLSTVGPYYGLAGGRAYSSQVEHRWITFDRVPEGEVELTPSDHAHTPDGKIGKIHGVLVHPEDHAITHVLLDEGHLWNKKEVAIPMSVVARVGDGIDVDLSKKDVRDLPRRSE